MGAVKVVKTTSTDTIESLTTDWVIHMEAAGRAPRAIATYLFCQGRFLAWLDHTGRSHEVGAIRREDIEAWTSDSLKTLKPATVSLRWRAMATFFKWLADDLELIPESPFRRLHAPKVPEKVVPVLPEGAIQKLLKAAGGKSFKDRRDFALISLMADTGMRLSEVADLRYLPGDPDRNDVRIEDGWLRVMGKGQRERRIPLARTARAALSRYLLLRRGHAAARLPWLWLSTKHVRLTDSGIRQALQDRAAEAKLGIRIHPHMLRHNYAHQMKVSGMSDEAIMQVAGWRSRSMLARYGNSAAAERAAAEHLRHSLMDHLG